MSGPSELERTARDLSALAERAQLAGSPDAVTLAESAASVAHAAGAHELEHAAAWLGARAAYASGDLARAERNFRRAAEAAQTLGDRLAVARVEASLAFLAYDRAEPATAHAHLDAVVLVLDALPEGTREPPASALKTSARGLRALVEGYRGNLARQAGAFDDARAHYQSALDRASAADARSTRATFTMDLGAAEIAAGRFSEAGLWLRRAAREVAALAPGSSRSLLEPLVDHYRALLTLGAAGAPLDAGPVVDVGGPAALVPLRTWLYDATLGGRVKPRLDASLRRRLERLREDGVPFEHARFGVSLLSRLVGLDDDVTVSVARDGSVIASGALVADLSTREPLRRIVESLVQACERDLVVSLEGLVRSGWPGERMKPEAARNRAHVALSTLRSLGLGPVLVRRGNGYTLERRSLRVLD